MLLEVVGDVDLMERNGEVVGKKVIVVATARQQVVLEDGHLMRNLRKEVARMVTTLLQALR